MKLLTEEEERELNDLLSKGFENWKRSDYLSFVQACIDFGIENTEAITEVIGTNTVEEVRAYSKVFMEVGR